MSFSDLFDLGSGSDMSYGSGAPMPAAAAAAAAAAGGGGAIPQQRGLSFGVQQADVEGGQGAVNQMGTAGGGGVVIRDVAESDGRNSKDDDDDGGSQSESENVDGGGSGVDVEQVDPRKRKKKKKYIRHTPQQIQELENLFKESPHPDENQRMELGRRLNLESRQVKFWFQNRRTQMKTQIERHENTLLKQENDKLRSENISIREAIKNPICSNCGGPSVLGEVQAEEHLLGIENARLKDDFDRVCALAAKFVGKRVPPPPISCYSLSSLELTVGTGPYAPGPSVPAVRPQRPAMPSVPPLPAMPVVPPPPIMHVVPPPPTMPAVVPPPPTMPAVPPPLTMPAVVPPQPTMPAVPPSLTMPAVAPPTLPAVPLGIVSIPPMGSVVTPTRRMMDRSVERSMFLELAMVAMNELVKMAQLGEPLWVAGVEIGKVMLNYEEYLRMFPRCINTKPLDFVSECTRESGLVIGSSMAIVDTLMDGTRWMDLFPSMVGGTTTTEIISNGVGGTRNGALQLMHAELQIVSPLVPNREVNFLRFCKQHAEGVWAVVDVSVDGICDFPLSGVSNMSCRRLPSGCLVQDMPNGYSKVTWVEHAEYDEMAVHQIYRPLVRSGMGLGAQRWIATLQRHCECLAIVMSPSMSIRDTPGITASGKRSIVKLAQRMTKNFCIGACASSSLEWNLLNSPGEIWENTRVMTRNNIEGEPPGIILSASMSMWMPISPRRIFNFLSNKQLRCQWDVLSITGPLQEIVHVAKGQDHGNAVSLFCVGDLSDDQYTMLLLQDTCTDASGSTFVYAPVDVPSMHLMMNGGDPTYVAILPSGFAIVPDGPNIDGLGPLDGTGDPDGGSLVSIVFQILVDSLPGGKLSPESVGMVNDMITCSLQKIKVAFDPEN